MNNPVSGFASVIKVVALAGGVGGAKLAEGLSQILTPDDLTVIVNTGDDFNHCGLQICPDIDTVMYTLSGLSNPETGWGRQDETWYVHEERKQLGEDAWFQLGDKDLALHLERTRLLAEGQCLSEVIDWQRNVFSVKPTVLPMSNQSVRTQVITADNRILDFQEYFVHLHCEPHVKGFDFLGCEKAQPVPAALEAIESADIIVICPSNPWVSIGPILAVKGYREALMGKQVVAVSPIIGGKALKGPAAKMYLELGIQPSAAAVAESYAGLISHFVIDTEDERQAEDIKSRWGIMTAATKTIMRSSADRAELADFVLSFATR